MVQVVCLPLPFFVVTLFHRLCDEEEGLLYALERFATIDE
jgi:hypothetical protein